jgi:hypothetical protein
LPRQWVNDFLVFAKKVPSIPVLRSMNIKPLVDERNLLEKRVSWVALFTKAFSLVAREIPELRQAYMGRYLPKIYEHPFSVASIAVERDFRGQNAVMMGRIPAPENMSLTRLTGELHKFKHGDVQSVGSYRELLRMSRLPLLMRRFLWWFSLNVSGYVRSRQMGTFTVSVYAQLGAESLHPISPLTSLLNYGRISPSGAVDVRIIYDHRVMDGSTVARALGRLEEVLRTDMVAEVQALRLEATSRPLPIAG